MAADQYQDPPVDEFGIPIKKKGSNQPMVDEFGIPVKKKGGTALSTAGAKAVPTGGQVGSSKAPSSGLVQTGTETQVDIDRQKKFAEMEGVEYDSNDPLKSYVRANENKFAKQRQKPATESTSSKIVKLAESIQNKEAVKEKAKIESFRFNNVEEAKEFAYKRLDKSKLVPKSANIDLTKADGLENYTDESILQAAGDNYTVNKAVSQYLRNKNVKENLQSSANFSEAAIKTALTKNDDRAAQISKLLASGREIPSTMRGDIVLEYLNDPDVLEEVSSNPELLSQYRKEIYDFPKSNPETAIKIMAQMVSKKREEKGYNNGLLNAPSKSTTDEIIDELVQEGQLPVQYKYLYERPGVSMAVNSSLKTPGFIEGTLQSANEAVEGIGSSLKAVADFGIYNVGGNIAEETGLRNLYSTEEQQAKNDFYKSTESLYNGLDREFSEVAFKPKSDLHNFTSMGGLVTGQVLPMIVGGGALRAANLVNTAEGSNMIMAGMQSFGRNKERAAVELPNASAEKQLAYATLNTGIELALSNVFNDVEYARKLMKGVSPEVKSVITRFTNKEITESVAKQSINDIFLKVAEKGGQVAKGMVGVAEKEAREEYLTEILQIANNQVFGGQDVDAYDIAKKSFDVWRTTFLGSLPLGVGGGVIEVSKNPTMQKLVYEMATNPEKYAKIIQENSQLDEQYGADLDQKMSNLEYIAKVKQDLDAMEGMNQVDKEKFLITSLNQKIVADQAAQITEPTLRKEPEKSIEKLESEKEQILSNPTPLTKEQEAIKAAVDNGTLQGMNQMMAVEAIKDPEVAKSYLQMVADQAKNEVATVEGAETQSKANIDFGEDLVKMATEMFPKLEPGAEDISQPIELDPTLPEGYELPEQPQVETEVNIPELPKPTKQEEIKVQKDAIEVEKQQAITEATKPVVDLELLGDEQQTIDLITEKASGDKDGGKAKIRQHERIRARLQALKDLIDCV